MLFYRPELEMGEMNAQISVPAAERKLSKFDITGTSLVVLSFALLPIGRTVEIPTVLMALCGLFLMLGRRSAVGFWNGPSRTFAVFFSVFWIPMAISVIGSENFTNSAGVALKYLRFLFAGLFTLFLLRSEKIKQIVLAGLSVTVSLWLADSLIQWLLGIELLGRVYDGERVSGPFKDLILPIFLSLFLPLSLIYARTKWPRSIFWGIFFLSILILFLAGSRASLLSLMFGAVLYGGYVFSQSGKKIWLPVGCLIISLAVITGAGYALDSGFKSRIDRTVMILTGDYQSINEATSFRLPIWEAAYKMAIDQPINGVGIKSFRHVYSRYAVETDPFKESGANHAHLFLLEVFAETGGIGLVSLLVFWIFLLKTSLQAFSGWSPLQAGSAITLIVAFFPLNAHVSLYASAYSQALWLMVAICCAWLDEDESLIVGRIKR